MAIIIKHQATGSTSTQKPSSLAYGELAVDRDGYIYAGSSSAGVVSAVRVADNCDEANNAKTVSNLSVLEYASGTVYIPKVKADGVMEVGQYIDFHVGSSTADYNIRLQASITNNGTLYIWNTSSNGHLYAGSSTFAGDISTTNNIWATGNTAIEHQIGVASGSGSMYMYAQSSSTGYRGLYSKNSSGTAQNLLCFDQSGYGHAIRMYNAVWNDYAEYFPRGEDTEPGDIIALNVDSECEQYVKATSASKRIVGVHSDEYGHIIGGENAPDGVDPDAYNLERYIPVGLVGRCRVKVCGKVCKGDNIVPSNIPGVGRAAKQGEDDCLAVGFAVESFKPKGDEVGKVRVKLRG